MKGSYICEVLENEEIIPNIHKIRVARPKNNEEILPGQFFNIKCGEEQYPLLRRPISIGLADKNSLTFYVNKVGKGTELLCNKEKGKHIDILGPLGNGFDLSNINEKVLVVGGGIGVAPLLELTKRLSGMKSVDFKVVLGYKDEPFLTDEFKKYTEDIIIVSENKKYDFKGFVTDYVTDELRSNKYGMILTCGPKPMLKVVKEIGDRENIDVQLLMEERMACGIGACLVCTCKVKKEEDDWQYVRTCKEGPVFYGKEVIFDE